MYDWVKVLIPPSYWDSLYSFPFYDGVKNEFRQEDYGEASKECFYYQGIQVCFRKNKRIELSGSFHFFKNRSAHKADDFTLDEFKSVLTNLGNVLGIDWHDCELLNFEFGVNIEPPITSLQFLRGCYFLAKTEFNSRYSGYFKEFRLSKYILKIYDKAHWCKCRKVNFHPNTELLRIEIKTKKKIRGKDFGGVVFLTDLLKKEVINSLLNELVGAVSKLVFYDSTIDVNRIIKDNPRSKIKDMRDFSNWQKINVKEQRNLAERTRERLNKQYKRWQTHLREVSLKYGQNIQEQIKELIRLKWMFQASELSPNLPTK